MFWTINKVRQHNIIQRMGNHMIVCFYFMVYINIITSSKSSETQQFCTKQDSEMLFAISTWTMDSQIACGIACQQAEECESFSYERSNEVCKLHDMDPLKTHFQVVESEGFILYHVTGCETGWDMFGGKCYLFSTVTGTWEYSKAYCESKKATLVIVNTWQEHQFLQNTLLIKGNIYSWIGARYNETAGEFRWIDGTEITVNGWFPGKPAKYKGCADIIRDYQWRWNTAPCSFSSCNLICEKEC